MFLTFMPLSGGFVGAHELILTVGAPCYKSRPEPRSLWAPRALHGCLCCSRRYRAASSGTEGPRLQFVASESRNRSHTCASSRRRPRGAGGEACGEAHRGIKGGGVKKIAGGKLGCSALTPNSEVHPVTSHNLLKCWRELSKVPFVMWLLKGSFSQEILCLLWGGVGGGLSLAPGLVA